MIVSHAGIMFLSWSFVILILVKSCYSDSLTPETFYGNNDMLPMTSILDTTVLLLNYAKKYADGCSGEECLLNKPMDCAEILEKSRNAETGIYNIWPRSRVIRSPIRVYCDMDDDGGGWTASVVYVVNFVIQRRGDFDSAKDYFYQDWNSYKIGFGDPWKDYWLGNDNIFALTNQRANALKFTLTDWEKNTTHAVYEEFWIDDEGHNYTSHVKGYRGTAGDSFSMTNEMPFTTKDRDNDKHEKNCAVMFQGAWWYVSCHSSNLNGNYLRGLHESHADGVNWRAFRGHKYSLKDTFMKIRPTNFQSETNGPSKKIRPNEEAKTHVLETPRL